MGLFDRQEREARDSVRPLAARTSLMPAEAALMRRNVDFVCRAINSASDVLPVPGGP